MLQSSNSFNRNSLSLEEVMYDFLDAISSVYHNSMILKGCMCLKIQLDNSNIIRGTRDLDFHFFTRDDWEDFVSNSCSIATIHSKNKITYSLTHRRGFKVNPNSDSIKIKACSKSKTFNFKIDMNISDCKDSYEPNSLITNTSININSIYGILSDKLNVLSSRKACRRIKDLLDVYYICKSKDNLTIKEVYLHLKNKEVLKKSIIKDGCYLLIEDNYEELRHAYDRYKINVGEKPSFNTIYEIVYKFCEPIFSRLIIDYDYDCIWSKGGIKMEGTDLDLAISKLIGNNKLCLFSALYYWNLGNGVGQRPMFFSNRFSVETTEYSIFKCINGFDDFVKVEGIDLFYTDPYRTICDLVAYGIDELTILEALDDFVNMYSVDRLREYAVKYNVSEKLNSLLGEIEDGSYYLNYC